MVRPVTVLGITLAAAMLAGCAASATTTSSVPSSVATPSTTTVTTGVPVSVPTTPTTAGTTTPPPATTSVVDNTSLPGWDHWTLIYASLATGENTARNAEAIAATIEGAAVLLSDDYPSLNPGYWVVYAGEWGNPRAASAGCPESLASDRTCYPRYLGPDIPALVQDGAGLAQLDEGRLVALDLATGDVLATFSDNFHWEAEFPSSFNLSADAATLYFGMGWEDSWFSCESDGGQVWRLDLDTGVETVFSPGWSPAMSLDGRFLAVVVAAECYPDPDVDGWVISPGSQIDVFDLADGDNEADYTLSVTQQPTSYDTPSAILRVTWDPVTGNELLVTLADGSVRRVIFDSGTTITDSPVQPNVDAHTFAAASIDHLYAVDWDGEESLVTLIARDTGEVAVSYEVDGWVTGFAAGGVGQVVVTTWDYLILPSGAEVPVAGGVNNLDW